MSEYPTRRELRKIKNWPIKDRMSCLYLLQYVEGLWNYREWGWRHKVGGWFAISTVGWSGNEDLIMAMRENTMFWTLCWFSSRRGGHFNFKLPTIAKAARQKNRPAAPGEESAGR